MWFKIIISIIVVIPTILAIISIEIDNGINEKKPDLFTLQLWKKYDKFEEKKLKKYCKYYWRIINNEAYGTYFSTFDELYKGIYDTYYNKFYKKDDLDGILNKKKDIKISINSFKTVDFNAYVANLLTVIAMVGSAIFGGIFSAIYSSSGKSIANTDDVFNFFIKMAIMLIIIVFFSDRFNFWLNKDELKNFYMICFDILEYIEREMNEDKVNKENLINREETIQQIKEYINSNSYVKPVREEIAADKSSTEYIEKGKVYKIILEKDNSKR
ncbi:hypothetical protein Ccar_16260 [Clostridium carboxidivorans P7]|uniref:Uncharacterized protein n=1 Tax=Clostridium carboxidivorans P7 TaxID=536227 RepID=C6PT14_9CLOT|nr:hypothetical protein [Clostridium carboxidivorans]AKN32331.1 hypothetical protein Ccar_16260 [Clostridium carboxidivorans P7]EET87649.1 hypothetical protein CcarbDRAFT_1931 [Clostridium carboxidivorans P7]